MRKNGHVCFAASAKKRSTLLTGEPEREKGGTKIAWKHGASYHCTQVYALPEPASQKECTIFDILERGGEKEHTIAKKIMSRQE